ncbi:MAG: invasion protein [Rhizobiales bacterium]|nr:invasion protein [Hyphomicrobiales bacterium]
MEVMGVRQAMRAVAIACALVLPSSVALAQQTQQPAANAAANQSAWVKICEKAPTQNGEQKEICITHHERLDGNSGLVIVSAAIRRIEGEEKERFMVMVPLGMALPAGVRVQVDQEEKQLVLPFTICHGGGCTAEVEATPEVIAQLKKGKQMIVAARNAAGTIVPLPVPLNGFTAAYDGAPVDSQKYAEARRELMLKIRERQIALARQRQQEAAGQQGQQGQTGQTGGSTQ